MRVTEPSNVGVNSGTWEEREPTKAGSVVKDILFSIEELVDHVCLYYLPLKFWGPQMSVKTSNANSEEDDGVNWKFGMIIRWALFK